MFRCYFCQQVTPPRTKKQFIVVETREKTYPARRSESRRPGRFRPPTAGSNDTGGKGRETQKEVPACPACAAKHHEPVVVVEEPVVAVEATDTPENAGSEATETKE